MALLQAVALGACDHRNCWCCFAAAVSSAATCAQVLRLLCGLLAVEAGGVIRSEAPLGGGRSDLLIRDREGVSLLVVEYKQRHSGAMSAHQHQDAGKAGLLSLEGYILAGGIIEVRLI
jgi:hypothetical protein